MNKKIIIFGILVLLVGSSFILKVEGISVYELVSNKLLGFVSASIEGENLEVTRTASTETICKLIDGRNVCNLVLYSGVRFVEEDEIWKSVEEARSLKGGYNVVYLENDPSFNIIVNDFNMTFFNMSLNFEGNPEDYPTFCEVTDSLNAKCDFKLDEKWNEYNETTGEVIKKSQLKFQYKWQMKNGEITKGDKVKFEYKGNPFGRSFSFGGNSTELILQDADSENLEDTEVDQGLGGTNYGILDVIDITAHTNSNNRGLFKFDISIIPLGQIIDEAKLFVYAYDNPSAAFDIAVHHIPNQTWIEEVVTWNEQPTFNSTAEDTINSGTIDGVWHEFTTTVSISTDYGDSNPNSSLILRPSPETGIGYRVVIHTKEYTGDITLRPYLNITYSAIPAPPEVTLISPTNNTLTSTLTHYFNASYTAVGGRNLVNATLYIWNSTNDEINQTTESITGTSNSTNISVTFTYDDVYEWNYDVCDDVNDCAWSSTNWTITIDTTPPTFTNLINLTADANSSFSYDIDATDVNSVSCFTVNDTNFKIDCDGLLENNTILSVQTYMINITVNDSANNLNSGIINVVVTVWDTVLKWDWAGLMTDSVSPDQICFIYRDGEYCFDETGRIILKGNATISRKGVNTTTWISSGGNLITKFGVFITLIKKVIFKNNILEIKNV